MPEKVKIRKAKTRDIPAVVEMAQEMWDMHVSMCPSFLRHTADAQKLMKNYCRRIINGKKSFILLAEVNRKIAGYLLAKEKAIPAVYKNHITGYVNDLYVKKQYRKKGIGKKLMKEAEKLLKKYKYSFYSLKVNTQNRGTHTFYKSLGMIDLNTEMVKKL